VLVQDDLDSLLEVHGARPVAATPMHASAASAASLRGHMVVVSCGREAQHYVTAV